MLGLLFSWLSSSLKLKAILCGVIKRLCGADTNGTNDLRGDGFGDFTCFNGDLVIVFPVFGSSS
jgi:hypothetical protein